VVPGVQQMRVLLAVLQSQQRLLESPREAESAGVKQLTGPPASEGGAEDRAWPGREAA